MSLSEGWSLSNVTRQLTVDVFASDPKEGRVISFSLSLSLSCLDSYRYRCFSFPAWLLQETHLSAVLPVSRRTQGLGKVAHLLKPNLSKHWYGEAVDTPSWKVFKGRMDGALSSLV